MHSHHILSQPPPSRPQPHPKSPVPQKLPQESTGPKVLDPVGPTSTSALVATISVPEGDLPADMQPLRIQLGGAKRVYKCQVEGCKEGPSTSQAAICVHVRKVYLGVGLVCLLCSKSFYNLDVFRHHKKHINGDLFVTSWGGGNKGLKCYLVYPIEFKMPHLPLVSCKYILNHHHHHHNFIMHPLYIYHYHHIVNIIITSLYILLSFHHCSLISVILDHSHLLICVNSKLFTLYNSAALFVCVLFGLRAFNHTLPD